MVNCWVKNGICIISDHKTLIATMRTPFTRQTRMKHNSAPKQPMKLDTKSINSYNVLQEDLISDVNKTMLPLTPNTPETIFHNLIETVESSMKRILLRKRKTRINCFWENDFTLNKLIDELIGANKSKYKSSTEIKKLRKSIRKRKRYLTNEFYKEEANKINLNAQNRQIKQMYENAKFHGRSFKRENELKCMDKNICSFFKEHFNQKNDQNPTPDGIFKLPDSLKPLSMSSIAIPESAPETEEIKAIILNLKNDKASCDIPPNILKLLTRSKSVMIELTKLMKLIWESEKPPDNLGKTHLTSFWKKRGSRKEPKNYRAIQVGSTVAKILTIVIINRIKEWYESQLLDFQNGFRSGRSTADGLYITKMTQHVAEKTNQEIFVLLVDLTAAFDRINRDCIFQTIRSRLRDRRRENKIINLLENLCRRTSSQTPHKFNLCFETTSGVRQGGPESPLLFNLYLDYVMRIFF